MNGSRPVLVVGRAGQLASDLAAAAGLRGMRLVALGRPALDLREADAPARAIASLHPRAIINAAAYTAVDRAESEPDLAFAINRDGPARLARACAAAGVPLVHVSTDQVFDGRREGGHREADPPNPLCTYGRSKLAGEEAVAAAGGHCLIVRVSWVFGPSGDNFVKKLLAWARDRDRLTIVSDQRGRPTFSPGLAAALLTLAARMAQPGPAAAAIGDADDVANASRAPRPQGLLHLAGASVMARDEQARAVMAASAARGGPSARIEPVLTRDFPTAATRPLNAELDCGLAASLYGIRLGPFAADLDATLDAVIGRRLAAGPQHPGEHA